MSWGGAKKTKHQEQLIITPQKSGIDIPVGPWLLFVDIVSDAFLFFFISEYGAEHIRHILGLMDRLHSLVY